MEIKKKDKIAIIGKSGAGKSTLINTLLGLNDDYAGSFSINNVEVKEIDKAGSGLFIDRLNKDTQDISAMCMEYTYWTSYVISNIGVLVTILILNKYLFIYATITSLSIFLIMQKRLNKQYQVERKVKKLQEKKTGLTERQRC